MLIAYYTFKELKSILGAEKDSDVHKWLLGKKIDRWGTGAGRVRITAYNRYHIDEYLGFPLPKEYKGRTVHDIIVRIYAVGENVSYYEGSYKWNGKVVEVLANDTYRVFNSDLGNLTKRWFELGKQ